MRNDPVLSIVVPAKAGTHLSESPTTFVTNFFAEENGQQLPRRARPEPLVILKLLLFARRYNERNTGVRAITTCDSCIERSELSAIQEASRKEP
jgi:hypothetical protein